MADGVKYIGPLETNGIKYLGPINNQGIKYIGPLDTTSNVTDPVINAEMGTGEQGRPVWVKALDFLTGHFPEQKDIPEVQTVDGQLQVNVPPTAEVPFLQSPEMAIGAGAAKGIGLAAPIGKRLLAGAREAAGWATGGASEVPAMVKGGAEQVVRNIKEAPVATEAIETLVKGGKTGELPKYAEGSSINLERLDTTNDIKQFINSIAPTAGIKKKRISQAETEKLGEELAWDKTEFLKQAELKGGFSSEEVAAMRQINTNALHDLFNSARNLPADHALRTDAQRMGVMDKYLNTLQIMKATSEKTSEVGRTLNYFKKMVAENPEYAQDAIKQKLLNKMMEKMGVKKLTDDMIDDIAKTNFADPVAVRAMLQKYHKSSLPEKIYFAWINGLLSGFPTHAANIIGNLGAVALKTPEHALANIIQRRNPWGEASAETVGMINGIMDGVRASIKSFQTGVPSDLISKTELHNLNPIPGMTGKIIGVPVRALTAADEFFKAVLYRSELHRQAFKRTHGLSGESRRAAMDAMINNPESKGFQEIHALAEKEALYRTYQQELGTMGKAAMRFRESHAALKYIAPFIKTPVNIAKFTLERTPLGLIKHFRDLKMGELTAQKSSEQLANITMGSMISAAVTIAALNGNITGGPPTDKKERELKEAAGVQWYSIKVGNTWYSYNRFEPVGSIMGITADFVETAKTEAEINEKAGLLLKAVTRNITSKTFVSGVSAALDAMTGTDPNKVAKWAEQTAGSIVPAAVGRIAGAMDPYVREVTNPLEAVQARIPGWSKSLPYKPEVTIGTYGGVPITKPKMREGGPLVQLFSPVQISNIPPDAQVYEGLLKIHELEKKVAKAKREAMKEPLRDIRRTNK